MDGPRLLSDDHLSYLIISTPHETEGEREEYDLVMCAPHFTGDGTSLHQSTHDLLALLASPMSESQLLEELHFSMNWVSYSTFRFKSADGQRI